MLQINENIAIDDKWLSFKAAGSSGPGGQNVNKLNTKVTVIFDLQNCESLSESQKNRIRKQLKNRVDSAGSIQVSSQEHRSQTANKKTALSRLAELLSGALKKQRPRKKTKIPFRAKQKRLENKKHQSRKKQLRKSPPAQ